MTVFLILFLSGVGTLVVNELIVVSLIDSIINRISCPNEKMIQFLNRLENLQLVLTLLGVLLVLTSLIIAAIYAPVSPA